MKLASAAAAVAALLLAGSVSATARAAPSPGAYRETARARTTVRFIYTESSAAVGNAMLAFRAAWDGSLRPAGTFATAGTGRARVWARRAPWPPTAATWWRSMRAAIR